MALKKSQLYSSLWQSCDELRGGMDASEYKDYVLTLLFMKYVTDKYAGVEDAVIEVPAGGSFTTMVNLKGSKEIGEGINTVIRKLAEANDLKGVIDVADFCDESKLGSGKEMQDRLTKLVAIFQGLDFGTNLAGGDDLLGDAYEYLMMHFATESGKSKGQFYTPAEVSRVIAQVVGVGPDTRPDHTIYDPACGSGSLLLKAADQAPGEVTIYGQEMNNATWALARMNLILHGHPTAELWRGNTLAAPHFKNSGGGLRQFDFAVANPPFSLKAWTSGLDPEADEFERFEYGIPPTKNGDYAFLLHLIKSLKSTGKGAIILPHGVLFRGNREAQIRRNLVRRGLIEGIIGLPPNLFYGTGIPACIVVVDKKRAGVRTGIFMVDASRGFRKDGPKNRLRDQDIHRLVDVFIRQTELPRYSRLVPIEEIASPANDYNLNIPRYVDASEPEDLHDLNAHLKGGIPDGDLDSDSLSDAWEVFPSLRACLFQPFGRAGYSALRVSRDRVRAEIAEHPEVRAHTERIAAVFDGWREARRPELLGLNRDTRSGKLIATLSDDLLDRFRGIPLLDAYDVYQRLMDYWIETMQDDVYLVTAWGWRKASTPRLVVEDKKRKIKETPDLTVGRKKYKMDLLPPNLVIARSLSEQQAALSEFRARKEAATRNLQEFVEEHDTSDDGSDTVLADAVGEKGKITQARLNDMLRTLPKDAENDRERQILARCLALLRAESAANRDFKEAEKALAADVFRRFATLSEDEVKSLVVADKWLASLRAAVIGEAVRLVRRLAARIETLEDRYTTPLPKIECRVDTDAAIVRKHLRRMGLSL